MYLSVFVDCVLIRCRNIQHIQGCLSKITSVREKDLDLAQKYFAMLYVNEEVSEITSHTIYLIFLQALHVQYM